LPESIAIRRYATFDAEPRRRRLTILHAELGTLVDAIQLDAAHCVVVPVIVFVERSVRAEVLGFVVQRFARRRIGWHAWQRQPRFHIGESVTIQDRLSVRIAERPNR
jgi:hypothetical protein